MKTKLLSCCIALMATLQLFAVNDFSVDGINYTKLGGDSVEVGGNASLTGHVTIPSNVTYNSKNYRVVRIGDFAFTDGNLTSLSIPNSITSIGSNAIRNCQITQISIPNSVTIIEYAAFADCTSLTTVYFGNNVQKIKQSAFAGCQSLTSIEIPNSVIYTEGRIFDGTGISTPVYNSHLFVYMPTSYSGSYTMIDGISTIGIGAFKNCKNITDIFLPSSIRKISQYAFESCRDLSTITISENIDTIESCAFQSCIDLADVYINAPQPPHLGWDSPFPSNPAIHLACGVNYTAYQNSTWSNYNLEYPEANYTLTLSSDEAQGTINTLHALECNNDTAVIYAQANAGYHFTSWSDGNIDNPRTLIMTQDKTLHANFAVSLYNFTVQSEDETKGSVTGNNGSYQYGAELTITATPSEHYTFDHWKIEQERIPEGSIVAKFSIPASWTDPQAWVWETGEYGHWEQLSKEGEWYVYRTNDDNMHILLAKDQSYTGKTEDIDLAESACYIIGGDGTTSFPPVTKSYGCITPEDYAPYKDTIKSTIYENPYTFSISTNTKATAIFAKEQYQFCYSCINGYGNTDYSGSWNYGCASVEDGQTITVTITPYSGYVFQQWADGNTDNPRIFTITENMSVEAICIRDQSVLTLNTSDDEAGRVFGAGSYDKYSSVQIFAIPNSGYDFAGWSDGKYMNPRYLYLDEAEKTLTANFEITSAAQYVVNVSAQNPALGSAAATNYVRLDAAPFDGCTFVRWSDGNTDNPRYMALNADIELQAIFEGIPSNVESTSSATQNSVHKIIVNDQIFILRGEKVYTLQGQEVK